MKRTDEASSPSAHPWPYPALAATLMLLAPFAIYVVAYLALVGSWNDPFANAGEAKVEHYNASFNEDWLKIGFYPLNQIDRQLRPQYWTASGTSIPY